MKVTKSVFFWRRESQVYWDMQWRSPFQTYVLSVVANAEIRESSLCWKYRSFTSSPQIFLLVPFRNQHTFPLSAPSNHWSVFLIHIFLSECHTNGIIYYVALWVWLLSHATNNWRLSVMLSISFFSFIFVYLFFWAAYHYMNMLLFICLSVEGT